jgi:hypothetical protein
LGTEYAAQAACFSPPRNKKSHPLGGFSLFRGEGKSNHALKPAWILGFNN